MSATQERADAGAVEMMVCPVNGLDFVFGSPFPWANLTSAIIHYIPDKATPDPATIFDPVPVAPPAEPFNEELLAGMTPSEAMECLQALIKKYHKTGHIDDVIRLRMRSLSLVHLIYSSDHYQSIKSQLDLARSFLQKGLCAQALDHARKAWDFNYQSKNPEDNKLLPPAIQLTIGLCKLQMGRHADAKPHLERAKHLNNFLRGENHESIVPIYRALAACHAAMEEFPAAFVYLEKAQELKRNLHGENYDEVAEIYLEIAEMNIQQGVADDLEELYNKALTIYEAVNGPNCREVAQISLLLGRLMVSLNDLQKAIHYFKRAARYLEEKLGTFDPRSFNLWREIAFMMVKEQDYDSTIEVMKRVLVKELLVYGDPSIKVAKTYKFLGTTYFKLKRLNEAISMYEKAHRIYMDRYSASHAKTQHLAERVTQLRKRLV
eukprot:gnl/Hemi2/17613_TR5812_c0_g1_i1.p1 gnl/Hemi2/17613_TR5812_c0_g1~~gnl/Hemi2/17613_TR5812_c0_g1_i1.p1  ORF type:complete len:453 (+),score=165.52 gnl/Hemi2/17613_TR5812_c0_g1_i1:56-1360(+)